METSASVCGLQGATEGHPYQEGVLIAAVRHRHPLLPLRC